MNNVKKSSNLTYFADAFSLFQMMLFSLWMMIMVGLEVGDKTLNILILCLALFYMVFLFVKMLLLNRNRALAKKTGKITKRVYKYTKAILKIAFAAVVIIALVREGGEVNAKNAMVIFSFIGMLVLLGITVFVDIAVWFIKRKIRKRIARLGGKKKGEKGSADDDEDDDE